MTCPRVQQNLKAYLDGELGRLARVGVRAHLLRCEVCRAEAVAIRAACGSLQLLPSLAAPSGIRARAQQAARSMRPDRHVSLPSRRRWLIPAFSAVALAAALSFVFLTRPTPAQAAYDRTLAAADAVQTLHMTYWVQHPDGARETWQVWYAHGKWRVESLRDGAPTDVQSFGTGLIGGIEVYDGKQAHFYDPRENRVWLNTSDQPFLAPFGGFTVAAMLNSAPAEDVQLEQTRAPDGRSLNRFVIATQDGLGRIIVLADPKTDLPTAIEFYALSASEWQLVGGAERIEYDADVDPGLFVLTAPEDAEIIDKAAFDASFEQRYQQGMGRAESGGREAVLRDFQVVLGGDVFVIWTWTGNRAPLVFGDLKLEDSLGTEYIWARGAYLDLGVHAPAWFIAKSPPPFQPAWYRLAIPCKYRIGEPGEGFEDCTFSFLVRQPVLSPLPDPLYPASRDLSSPQGARGRADRAELLEAYADDPENFRRPWRTYTAPD